MARYREKRPPWGRSPRQVDAIQILTAPEGGGSVMKILEFFSKAWESVEILDHPPRVRMSNGGRSFVVYEGQWVVNPAKGAYYPMGNDQFRERYELVEDS